MGAACGGIMGGICKPEFECVNDPNVACIYGTDPDCTGVCLWIKPTCSDGNIICKGDDICYDMSNGPVCCDPNICMSNTKCDGPCEYYGLKGYECVANPMDACDLFVFFLRFFFVFFMFGFVLYFYCKENISIYFYCKMDISL